MEINIETSLNRQRSLEWCELNYVCNEDYRFKHSVGLLRFICNFIFIDPFTSDRGFRN